LTLLISLFILNSCKNKDTIGLDPGDTSTKHNGSLIDTSTVIVNTIPDIGNPLSKDSIQTSGLTKLPFGYLNDPVFGTVESNVALALNLPNQTTYSLPSGTIAIDSAVLVMPYADGFYGDSLTSKYKINVYQLANRIKATPYYNVDNWGTTGGVLGTRTFFARTHDSIQRYNIITGQPDTLIKVPAQLRVPIDKNFVNSILFNASSAQLASNATFLNNVHGLYLTLDKAGSSGAGGTFMFSSADSLNVYYRAINGTTIDTSMVTLPITTQVSQVKHVSSNTLTTEFADSTSSRDLIYLQGLAGTKVKIKFPYLKNINNTVGKIVVNRAELVITPDPGSTIPLRPIPKLTMYRYDIAKQIVELEDANANDVRFQSVATFGGYYFRSTNSYHFVITGYIQDLIDGRITDYGTYLAPIDTTNKSTVDINPTTQAAGRLIGVGTPNKNSPNYPNRIKLNIIYTKIKQ
jgi:hypothetical protein